MAPVGIFFFPVQREIGWKKSRPESQAARQEVQLAGTTSPGDVTFLLGAVPAEPAARGAGPQLVAALPCPAQVPTVLLALCPSVSAEVAVLQQLHGMTKPCLQLPSHHPPSSQPPLPAPRWLQPPGNAVGCCSPPACKSPPARPFGELIPEGQTS